MTALTPAQRELLEFIRGHQAEYGVTPSFDEMRAGIGLASKSGVHRMIAALEERGYIRRLKNRARAIEIVADPHLGPPPAQVLSFGSLLGEIRRRGYIVGTIQYDHATGENYFMECR